MQINSVSNELSQEVGAAPRTALGRLCVGIIRHRRRVFLVWLILFGAGGYAASKLTPRLSYDFSLPGQPAYQVGSQIQHIFSNGGNTTPTILVVTVPNGQSVASQESQLSAAFTSAQHQVPQVRFVDLSNTRNQHFITSNGRTTFAYLFGPPSKGFGPNVPLVAAQNAVTRLLPADHVGVTGIAALSSGGSTKGPSVLVETIVAGLGALAVLAFVFASFLALLPLLVAGVSILTTFLLLLGLSYLTPVSFIVQFLVSLVGLGVAIDYSLLVVTRWREERARGRTNDEAVLVAMETAGHSVVLSGVTVAIGLMSLLVLPVPFLRSTGLGGMLIPLVSVAVVLTLLPAILASVGPRWDWPRVRNETRASRGWTAWARVLARRPWWGLLVAIGVLIVMTLPVFHLRVGQTSASSEAQSGPAFTLFQELRAGGVPSGVLSPVEVLVNASNAPTTVARLDATSGVATSALALGANGTRGSLSDVVVIPNTETVNSATMGPVNAIEHEVRNAPGVVGVAGEGPGQQAFTSAVYGNTPRMLLILAVLTFLVLSWFLRSVVLALKAVLLNIVSLGATFGVLTWFWQDGHGSRAIFNIPASGAVTFWVPISVFAFLFGLSMDYEVFILTRIREEHDAGRNTSDAVIEGLGRTGRLITSAALILFLAFVSLASAPLTDLKIMATGLGIGILLDATVIRALLVPSAVVLLGKLNWWYPRFGRPVGQGAR
jgi:putative drug exporter of the RND superfamily